jgi:hypothetical protein
MDFIDKDVKKIATSPSILVWGLLIVAGVWFLYQIVEILLLLFLAIILSASLEPLVKRLMLWRIPRGVAIAVIYIGLFVFLFGLLSFLVPSLARETSQVAVHIPETLGQWGVSDSIIQAISQELRDMVGGGFGEGGGAVVSIDAGLPLNGATNYFAPWYLDWTTKHADIETPEQTVLSLLKGKRTRPGFEHDHHEVLALAAPRPFLLIGSSTEELSGWDRDDLSSWGYINRAAEVYRLYGAEENLGYVVTNDGHAANGPEITPAWQKFLVERLGG